MHFIPDPLHIKREMGGRFEDQPPREKGDHAVSLSDGQSHNDQTEGHPAAAAATFSITSSEISKLA